MPAPCAAFRTHLAGDTRLPARPICQSSACSTGSRIFQGIKPYPPSESSAAAVILLAGGGREGSCCGPSVSLPSRWWVKDEVAPAAPAAASPCRGLVTAPGTGLREQNTAGFEASLAEPQPRGRGGQRSGFAFREAGHAPQAWPRWPAPSPWARARLTPSFSCAWLCSRGTFLDRNTAAPPFRKGTSVKRGHSQ